MKLLRFTTFRSTCFLALSFLGIPHSRVSAERYEFRHEHVLGTSLELTVEADSHAAAARAEERVLAEISRLEQIFSTYAADSELMRWQAQPTGVPVRLSTELLTVLHDAERWRSLSQGAFHPGVGSLRSVWERQLSADQEPTAAELQPLLSELRHPAYQVNFANRTAVRLNQLQLTFDAIAKGAIIDAACEAIRSNVPGGNGGDSADEIDSALLNIGGDLRVIGDGLVSASIADPRHDAENSPPLAVVNLLNQSLATSGGYRRHLAEKPSDALTNHSSPALPHSSVGTDVEAIGSQRGGGSRGQYSHIFDPRTGQPTSHILSSSVIAPDATTADALATICSVLSVEESLRLIEEVPGAACLLVTDDHRIVCSPTWPTRLPYRTLTQITAAQATDGAKREASAEQWDTTMELLVNFEIHRPAGNSRGYRRPYVAVWVEDAEGFPVRTLALWLQTDGPGPRWHPDLRQWYRNDKLRLLVDEKPLIGTISAATRPPGKYKVVWDGKDDHGELVNAGKYTLFLEAAREHGTYQLMKHEMQVGGTKVFQADLEGNEEFKGASLDYRRRSDDSP